MSQRLKDLRKSIKNVSEADAEFAVLAMMEIDNARLDAECEAEIAKLKALCDVLKESNTAVIEASRANLAAFIESHPEEFSKPRKRKTDWGTYGRHTATKVNVFDKDAAILHCEVNGFADCLKTSITLLTSEVKNHLEGGDEIPGCELQSGEVALCTVKKELLEKAKEI